MKNWSSLNVLIPILFLISDSCKEQEDYEKTATIKFDITDATYTEDVTSVKIGVSLDYIRNENVIVKTNIYLKDTATYRDIDFNITPELLIKPFNKTSYFQLSIVNDKQIDLDDVIELTMLKPQNGNIELTDNIAEQNFKLIIKNNDLITSDKFQADLTWHRKNPADQVGLVNLNLYAQTNVVFDNGVITDVGDTFTLSEELNAFESINIFEKNPDQPYYLVVYFNLTFLQDIVTYTLTLNGFGFNNKNFGKVLADTDLGSAIFYGPFYKTGNKIMGAGRQSEAIKEFHLSKEQLENLGFNK